MNLAPCIRPRSCHSLAASLLLMASACAAEVVMDATPDVEADLTGRVSELQNTSAADEVSLIPFQIHNPSTGLCLDSFGRDGSAQMYPCHGQGGNQQWRLNLRSGELRNLSSGLCLDSGGQDGPARMDACHGQHGNQQWRYDTATEELTNPSTGRCLDSWGGPGAVRMHPCHRQHGNQSWVFTVDQESCDTRTTHHLDADNDGHGGPTLAVQACEAPAAFTPGRPDDCDDTDASVHPNPDAPDVPDGAGQDSDCDGVDGELDRLVFVAPNGSDDGDGTRSLPFRTLQKAIDVASARRVPTAVAASVGEYHEQVVLRDGVSLLGGYERDAAWRRTSDTRSRIVVPDTDEAHLVGIDAEGLSGPIRLQRLDLVMGDAIHPGGSLYGVRVVDSRGVHIEHVSIVTGSGAAGATGRAGADGARGGKGGQGGAGRGSRLGGAGGTSACGRGAAGGAGGARHALCASDTGWGAAGGGECGGDGGARGFCRSHWGRDGKAATASCSVDGHTPATVESPTSIGVVQNGYWHSAAGPVGPSGTAGTPGSGGGGGGGPKTSCARGGSGGGGGGGAGCGGDGGRGGQGGGSVFGIFVLRSTFSHQHVDIAIGDAGHGGVGGPGGKGGRGGVGGAPGEQARCGGPPSRGGRGGAGSRGGNGGAGGAGGGGAGGLAVGIYSCGGSHATGDDNLVNVGSAGVGGGTSDAGRGPDGHAMETFRADACDCVPGMNCVQCDYYLCSDRPERARSRWESCVGSGHSDEYCRSWVGCNGDFRWGTACGLRPDVATTDCPLSAAPTTFHACGCVPGVSGDSDRDGVPNCSDQCPDDRSKSMPGECGCGVSDYRCGPAGRCAGDGRRECICDGSARGPRCNQCDYNLCSERPQRALSRWTSCMAQGRGEQACRSRMGCNGDFEVDGVLYCGRSRIDGALDCPLSRAPTTFEACDGCPATTAKTPSGGCAPAADTP